ncbi:putative endo-beta-1,4-glucanase D [Diplogelasinospora grovesii]|uniref:lytic cellulose monooxygenase (C4-dehydrogenating) n=1 Tax=Diplogelasinospora grovesii TaxID=303347 RepID=A0AAN6S3N3_9PEZI|nr:putative endo-beta-1,4-glucanase D [Diplogelasinospora grovesii]
MKTSTLLAEVSLGVADLVSGHYIFQQLTVGSKKFGVYEHIRYNTNYNSPVTSLTSNDLRCNVGGETGTNTTTIDVKAGDAFTFHSDVAVYHQGPISLYMSKARGAAHDYDGSGNWFKIYDWGPTFSGGQATWPMRSDYAYNIPRCIPNGEYLLRIQSLAIHNPGGTPQWYVSCAQVNVSGGGSATPAPTCKIPGAFKATDPGYTANIYNGLKSYTVPGPAVFTC